MNLLEFAAKFAAVSAELEHHTDEAIKKGCELLEKSAKEAIGTYEFGWPALGPAAVAKHGDTPLLDTGALRDSIEHQTHGHEGWVGTNDEKAKWQEFGTSRGIPPRPFIGGAVSHTEKEMKELFVDVVKGSFKS